MVFMSTTTFPAPTDPDAGVRDDLLSYVLGGRKVATLVMDGGKSPGYDIVQVAPRDFRVAVPGVPASIRYSFTTIRKAFAFAAIQGGWG